MSVSPAPETTAAPVAWRGLAWAALPPLLVLALRALMPGEVDAGALQRLETATLVSDPAEAFWMAARPLALGLLVLAVAAGACLFAVRRWGWARLRPALLGLWAAMWLAMGVGLTASDMNRAARDHGDEIARRIPAGRIGTPEDLAAAAIYLASRAGDYVLGETLVVDGGVTHARG